MRKRRHGIDRSTAERLLTGHRRRGPRPLIDLLSAASAPAHAAELAGEQAAVAAFRAAAQPTAKESAINHRARKPRRAAKLVVAGGAAAFVSVGGLALAASTGTLPAPAQAVAHHAFGGLPAAAAHGKGSSHATGRPAGAGPPHATPSPSLPGLCRAYLAGVADSKGKALDNPAFTALVTAAGGADQVTVYCTDLVGAASAHPGAPAHPAGAPSTHPSGPPQVHPTGAPIPQSTGPPSGRP